MSDHELQSLKSAGDATSLEFGLFGISLGAFLSLGITLKTVPIGEALTYAAFWAGFLVAGLAWVYFAIRAVISHRATNALVTTIKTESVTRESELFDEIP